MRKDDLYEYLNSVNVCWLRYQRAVSWQEQLRDRCSRVTAVMDGMPHSGQAGRGDGLLTALAQAAVEADQRLAEWRACSREVEAFLDRVENPLYRTLLQLRYVDDLSWPEVRARLEKGNVCYSERQIFRLHGDALVVARRLYDHCKRKEP